MKPGKTLAKPAKKAAKKSDGESVGAAARAAAASKKSKDKRPPIKVKGPIVVGAREEEYEYVQRETCHCGGGFEVEMEDLKAPTENSGPLDILKSLCIECGSRVDFQFDISSFYDGSEEVFGINPSQEPPEEDEGGGWLS